MNRLLPAGGELDRRTRILLTASMLLCVLPHVDNMPVWTSLFSLTLLSGELFSLYHTQWRPWKYVRDLWRRRSLLIVFLCLLGVYLSFGTIVGRSAGTALLILMATLKVFESCNERDVYVCSCLACFVAATVFFHNQTIPLAMYTLLIVAILTGVLIAFNDPQRVLHQKQYIRGAVKFLAQAIPMMVVLFIVFPRVQGPLWRMPPDPNQALTGVSDSMSPGSFNRLIKSNEVAFRAEFGGSLPSPRVMYWRGPVMSYTNGREWHASKKTHRLETMPSLDAKSVSYAVIQEKDTHNWLFPLQLPASIPSAASLTPEFELKTHNPLRERTRFVFRSYPGKAVPYIDPDVRKAALRLPPDKHPRTVALATQWRDEGAEVAQIIGQAKRYFVEGEFGYTLEPNLITGDTVDTFLFEDKRGFCEHYASAFTVLMRAAGVPARVVTGYQGGELNQVGNFVTVRQYQAHAWSEVWSDEAGSWIHIDPTYWVSPERIEAGMEAAFSEQLDRLPLARYGSSAWSRLWRNVDTNWDALNYRWTKWVLAYGPERQRELFRELGMQVNVFRLSLYMVGLLVLLFLVYLYVLTRQDIGTDRLQRCWRRFCRKLIRAGVPPGSLAETQQEFADRASHLLAPANRAEIVRIVGLWLDIRYGSRHQKAPELLAAVKAFRVQGKPS